MLNIRSRPFDLSQSTERTAADGRRRTGGYGPPRCLGLEVAKQEVGTALNALMDRYPNMRLESDAPMPELLGGVEQRGMSAVPVILK